MHFVGQLDNGTGFSGLHELVFMPTLTLEDRSAPPDLNIVRVVAMSLRSLHETTSQSDVCMSRGAFRMVFPCSLILSPDSTAVTLQLKVAEHVKAIK